MTTGKISTNIQDRIQFLNNESVAVDDTFEFTVRRGLNTVFATSAFRTEILVGDVKVADAVDADYKAISTDGNNYDFDGTITNVRVLTGPGHYRLVATGVGSNVYAGIEFHSG